MMPNRLPKPEEIDAVYAQGPVAVKALVEGLYGVIRRLEERVQALEEHQVKDSHNSSKPPSSDGLKKPMPKSQRPVSGKARGGQKGHRGHRLEPVEQPDKTEVHRVEVCHNCQMDLSGVSVERVEARQVFELPAVRLEVTEHQAEVKRCPGCGHESQAAFPAEISQPTQYGPRFRAQLVYFHTGQFIPLARTAEMVEGLYGQPVSEATVLTALAEAARRVEPINDGLKTYLVETSEAVQFDETGTRVAGKGHWLHAAGTTHATVYTIHAKRGRDGMDQMGILTQRQGWCVHDGWKPYFHYALKHALCNAHHLRELTFVAEQYQQHWAVAMRHELCQIKTAVENAQAEGRTGLYLEQIAYFKRRYANILDAAEDEMDASPPPDAPPSKKHPAANLVKRLRDGRDAVLAFMSDFRVPFDNNLAERDVRMMKVHQKVSGGFRQSESAQAFCAVRGYIATARKNDQAALTVLTQALMGTPFIPPCALPFMPRPSPPE